MKKKLLIYILILSAFQLNAQFANDWIDYSKPYFKISVNNEGIYRINSSVLNSVGLNFINSDNFQVFRDGKQVPLYINKTGSTVNYLEFFAYGNDGKMDSMIFKDPDYQIQDKMSLFSSTASYYLTFNDIGGNLRINEIANNLTNLPAKETHFYYKVNNQYTASYSYGEPHYVGGTPLYSSLFDKGEGYMGGSAQQVNNATLQRNFSINVPYKYAAPGLNATLKTSVVAWTNGLHHFNIKTGNTTLSTYNFNNYDLIKSNDVISNSLVSNPFPVTLEAVSTASGANRNTMSFMELNYPRAYNFGGNSFFSFEIEANGNVQYLELDNVNSQGTQAILYDITNGYRIVATDAASSSTFRYALPAAIGKRKLVMRANNSANYNNISSLSETYFKDYTSVANQGDYIILSHTNLISSPELQAYKTYRESIAGGAHDVVVVDVVELYDQFAYGIDHHAATVRNFTSFAVANWQSKIDNMFIIGKGREYNEYRYNSSVRNACLVPTFGKPGSDNLLTADLISDVPNIPVGRIAAKNATQINTYLQKVIEYETELNNAGDPFQTIANKDYMKQILHFGGGSVASQQLQFRAYLDNYKTTVQDTLWGANTYSVFKTNSNPLQNIQSQILRERIDNGVSLITFFGHSYAGGFDLSFDEPENYSNIGKYPVYLANGCNAGAIHSGGTSISERFIFAQQKGAIAYMSTTALSVDASLNTFSNSFYQNLAKKEYNAGLGNVIQQTIQDVENCCSSSPIVMMIPHEMTLNGDPAIQLNQYEEPDYNIEPQNVFFTPNAISTSIDSFDVNLLIYNLGKAIDENIDVEVSRILPDGNEVIVSKNIKAPLYKDTVSFKFAVLDNNVGLGLNRFNIYVDNTDIVANEISETNNYLINEVSLLIGSDDIYPVYPYEFAIVPNQALTLKASTGNTLAPARNYVFQIDTSELFLNPLAENTINSGGGVVNFTPGILLQDSTVYYWRVSIDDSYNGSFNWQYSSFIYLANEFPGWNQSHYYQWQKDNFANIYIDNDRDFKFVDDVKDIFIQTGNYPTIAYQDLKWELNGALMHNWSMNICSGSGGFGYKNGLSIATIDNVSGLPKDYANIGGNYGAAGNIHCNNATTIKNIANFPVNGITPSNHPTPGVAWSQVIINYLNSIPNNHYVLMYSVNNPGYGSWSSSLVNYLNTKGSSVNNATNAPMILVYQNNNPTFTPVDIIGNSFSDIISVNVPISGTWSTGNLKSTLIGPAQEWGSFHWRYAAKENPTQDQQNVLIYGVDNGGNETLLANVVNVLDTTLNFINASQYPYLKLKLESTDLLDRTPAQTRYWRVLFDPAPELAINPNLFYEINKDTLVQGDTFTVKVAVENLSPYDFDSLWLKEATGFANNTFEQNYTIYDSLRIADTLQLKYSKKTIESKYLGNNSLILEANPLDYNHQLEQFHFNNFAILNYVVQGDEENPLLDVTFDGIHILDGDIVSAKPTINIQLLDENEFLALDDTTSMDVFVRSLNTGVVKRIAYENEKLSFFPASGSSLNKNNKALIVLKEDFPEDGTYELLVKARDKSGNSSSGTEERLIDLVYYDYKISFEIINKSSISNVLNYPNPFTTQTHFVFTLTGSVIPDNFEIKIFNIKGTLVRQIRKEELGDIHIGVNKTQFTWDGTDQYGDKMANGVYLYKVYTSINNEDIDQLQNEQVDKFFTKGFGKMVFIR
ncbi:MAG: C25 family cysteine peptidase [Chitinophagales bacterium]